MLYFGANLGILNVVTVPHKMVGLERMSDYRGFTVRKIQWDGWGNWGVRGLEELEGVPLYIAQPIRSMLLSPLKCTPPVGSWKREYKFL